MDSYRAALILVTGVNLFAVIRLLVARVAKTQPVLLGFLTYQLFQNLLGVLMSASSRIYQEFYTFTEPLNWVFYLFTTWEMYRRAFSAFPGIASMARWASYVSIAGAVLIGLVVACLSASPLGARFSYVQTWEKCTCFALAAFIVLMVFLLSRYPIRVGWNEAVSIVGFTVYFFGNFAALELSANGNLQWMQIRNYGLLLLYGVCYLAWGLLLRSSSESLAVQVRSNLDSFEERRLIAELRSINNLLVKAARQ